MPSLNNLRILIADDHEVVRQGLKTLLSSRRGWIVRAEAANGREAVSKAKEHRPDIVVMDISMPGLNGLEATRQIRKILPDTEVLILSVHYSDQLVREIVDAGARGYVLKSDASTELLIAVEALANHRVFFTSSAAQMFIDGFRIQRRFSVPHSRRRFGSRAYLMPFCRLWLACGPCEEADRDQPPVCDSAHGGIERAIARPYH